MERLSKFEKNIWIRRVALVIYDIVAVVIANYFALLLRFDFDYQTIPEQYMKIMTESIFPGILIMLITFYAFRLYSSLWTYAGGTEFFYMIVG